MLRRLMVVASLLLLASAVRAESIRAYSPPAVFNSTGNVVIHGNISVSGNILLGGVTQTTGYNPVSVSTETDNVYPVNSASFVALTTATATMKGINKYEIQLMLQISNGAGGSRTYTVLLLDNGAIMAGWLWAENQKCCFTR